MHVFDQRVNLLLSKRLYEKVTRLARRRGVPANAVIRDAIEQLPDDDEWEERRQAIKAILAAEPIDVPDDPRELRREIHEARARFPK
jgi:metal-responsive CopG/Arc/MetJ family transcriptional regulator